MRSTSAPPRFSVILPSYNGADTLPACLEALSLAARPEGGAEFIFVDNRSTDATGALLAEAATALGGACLHEARPGKSHALNAAIVAAQGEYLVFTDDDTLADSGWLRAYEAAAAAHPEVGVFAGQIRPRWRVEPPDWLKELARRGQIAGCTPADHPAGVYPAYWVKGANVMVRRALFAAHAFDTGAVNFGASSSAIGGEDTKLMRALADAGERIYHVPDAFLRHIVQPHEAEPEFILRRQMRIGRGNTAIEGLGALAALRKCADIAAYALWAPLLFALGKRAAAFLQIMKIARRLGMLQAWMSSRS